MEQKKRVKCLYRVSSKQQLRSEDIPVQREECRAYIETHQNWEFEGEYVEKAVSGFKTSIKDRDVLQDILSDARQRVFDVLLVYMSDRIGRKEDESPVFVTTLNNLGIEVWSVKEGQLKTQEHIDKLLNYIRFWQAEGESRKTGARVKDAQMTFARAGRFVGGYAPYGYRLEYSGEISNHGRALKHLVRDDSKTEIIEKIFDYSIRYNYGNQKIAKELNESKVPAIKDAWKASTISQILQNPIYMGYIAYNRRQHSGCGGTFERTPMENWIMSDHRMPELAHVSEDTWYLAQQMREARKARIKRARDEGQGYGKYTSTTSGKLALMGLIYCGCCGSRLTNGSKYDYWTTKAGEKRTKYVGKYRCTRASNGSMQCGGKALYRAEEIEPIVYSVVTSYLNSLKEADTYDEIMQLQEEQRKRLQKEKLQLEKQYEAVGKDIDTLQENIPLALRGEGAFTVDQLSALIEKKQTERQQLQDQIGQKQQEYEETKIKKNDISELGSIISNWGELFMESSIAEKKVLLGRIIERIDIYDKEIKIKFKINIGDYIPRICVGSDTTP